VAESRSPGVKRYFAHYVKSLFPWGGVTLIPALSERGVGDERGFGTFKEEIVMGRRR
jgi:hypothetical protein